jgi:hypothetical protein
MSVPPVTPRKPRASRPPATPRTPHTPRTAIRLKKVVDGGQGRIDLPVWVPKKSVSARNDILLWCMHAFCFVVTSRTLQLTFLITVIERRDDEISISFIQELQAFLYGLLRDGLSLGPHLRLLAADTPSATVLPSSRRVADDAMLNVADDFRCVGVYFGINRPKLAQRGFYDSRLESLVLSHLPGSETQGPVDMEHYILDAKVPSECCGRCVTASHSKAHDFCHQAMIDGALLKDGCCMNCVYAGASSIRSYRRKYSIVFQLCASF